MANQTRPLTLGLPRMHKEAGERRDFMPPFVRLMVALDLEVFAEAGIGSGMGLTDRDYSSISDSIHVVDNAACYQQDLVLQLRSMEVEQFDRLRPGSTFVSMLHFPTRPRRIKRLREMGVEAISLDSIADDEGRRLVQNMRAVAWNGLEAAFGALEAQDPTLRDPTRRPLRVTILGAGEVGRHAVEAATKYGSQARFDAWSQEGVAGAEATAIGRSLSGRSDYMRERLAATDVLVDASQRDEPSRALLPNAALAWLPRHAVVCDLATDPYVPTGTPPTVRGIEGIPLGNLDKYVFRPDDADWSRTIPAGVPTGERRTTVSCYSWPGVHPRACMAVYRLQLAPLMQALVRAGGVAGLRPDGDLLTRALWRASLRNWTDGPPTVRDAA